MTGSEIKALKCAAYYYGTRCGDFPYFFKQIAADEAFSQVEPWLRPLFQEDLYYINRLAKTKEIQSVVKGFSDKKFYLKQYDKIISGFSNLFDIDELPVLYLVDSLPDPFSDKEWDSMSVDDRDQEKFSIPRGIFYRKAVLTHCYFEFVIAHEIAHWVISRHSGIYFPYVTLFEEGICDFLAAYILYNHSIVPASAVTNLFAYNRSLKPPNSLWYAYWIYCKAAMNLALKNGFEEIIKIVKSGRENIRKFPIQNAVSINESPSAESNIKDLACALLTADALYTVSAEEFMVLKTSLQFAGDYINPERMAEKLKIPAGRLTPIISNLDRLGLIVIESNDRVYQPSAVFPDNIKYVNL